MTDAAAEPTPETPATDVPTITLEEQVISLTAELATAKDQMLRALAEAENTRRRAERDRDDMAKYAVTNFARGLLSVVDNLRRAIVTCGDDVRALDPKISGLIDGVTATERELLGVLERAGIKKVAADGMPFNANFHEVMFEAAVPGKQPGTIFQVIEDGYIIHDRLLRPARVGVVKAETNATPTPHTIDQQA